MQEASGSRWGFFVRWTILHVVFSVGWMKIGSGRSCGKLGIGISTEILPAPNNGGMAPKQPHF